MTPDRAGTPSPARNVRAGLVRLYLLGFLKNLHFFGAVAVPFFTDWAALDYTRLFLLEASFSFWMFVLEIPTGVVADRWGRRRSLALGGLLMGLSFVVFGTVNSYAVYFVAEFLCAAGMTLMSGADRALIYDTLSERGMQDQATVVFSRYETAGILGMIAGLPAGSLIAATPLLPYPAALPLTFIASAAAMLAMGLLALGLHEPPRAAPPPQGFVRQGVEGFLAIFRRTRLRAFSLNYALISGTTFLMYWLYQPLLKRSGFGIEWNGVVGAAFNVAGILLLLAVARLERALGLGALLLITALAPGLCYAGLALWHHSAFMLFAVMAVTGLRQLRSPVLADYLNRQIDSANRATVLSGVSMIERVVIMVLYPIVGLLADRSLSWALAALGAATIAAALATRIGPGGAGPDVMTVDGDPRV